MQRSEKFAWLTILVVEATFMVLTRVLLARYPHDVIGVELARSLLRFLAVSAYWYALPELIEPQSTESSLRQPVLLLALALFLSVPLLTGDLGKMSQATRWVFAATSILVALKEEIAFRALIQNLLAKRFGNLVAVLGATALFTASHIGVIPASFHAYSQVAAAGLFLGIVFVHTQRLWLVIWLHTFYDALVFVTPVFSPPFAYPVGLALLAISTLLLLVKWPRRFPASQ